MPEQHRFLKQRGDDVLSLLETRDVTEGMQHPMPQTACAHRSASAVDGGEERMLAATAAGDEFEMALAGGVDQNTVARRGDAQAADVIDAATKLELHVLQYCTSSADGGLHGRAAEAVERLHFEVGR